MNKILYFLIIILFSKNSYSEDLDYFDFGILYSNTLIIETVHSFDPKWAIQISTLFQTLELDKKYQDIKTDYKTCFIENIKKNQNETLDNIYININNNCSIHIENIKKYVILLLNKTKKEN